MNLIIFKFVHSKSLFGSLALIVLSFLISCSSPIDKSKPTSNDVPSHGDKLQIEYIAHASFKLIHGGDTLLLDPYADSTWLSYLFPRDISAQAIFSTHPHYDHDGGLFRDLKPYWEGKIPFYQDPGSHTVGSFNMTGVEGKHCEPYGKEFGQRNTVWMFDVADLRIVHWGDNEKLNDSMAAALTDVDILMLPIDDEYHILKQDEIDHLLEVIKPKIIIPMHYRIAELEKQEGKPKDLGGIENYMKDRQYVLYLKSNIYSVDKTSLPKSPHYVVFKHSPDVLLPEV